MRDGDLSAAEKYVGLMLSVWWGRDGTCRPWRDGDPGGAGPSVATLASVTAKSKSVTRAALSGLEAKGYVRIEGDRKGGRGKTTRWVARFPDGHEDAAEAPASKYAGFNG